MAVIMTNAGVEVGGAGVDDKTSVGVDDETDTAS